VIALLICAVAFAATFLAARRSLMRGLGTALLVGYMYGIVRANVPSAFSHFIFDAALVGLYAAQFAKRVPAIDRIRTQQLRLWVGLLVGWPLFLLIIPIQDPLVQAVGLRAHVFFLPFLLLGARLDRAEFYRLALIVAGLNLLAFGFAAGEFFFGLPAFYPRNEVTDLLYRSNDIRAEGDITGAFRIPGTFANSAQYGSTMVLTLPLLLLGWLQNRGAWHRVAFGAALMASVFGVFFSATRTNMLMLGVLILVSLVSGGMGTVGRVVWALVIGVTGWTISTDQRLFLRLLSLSPAAVLERFTWSMNIGVLERMMSYPLGNGLGGGGTSMPYFLMGLVRNPIFVENQWATVMLEQGLPGLLLWVGFVYWVLSRRQVIRERAWRTGRRLVWIAVLLILLTGLIGQGLFTAVPTTALLFLLMGWLSVPERIAVDPPAPAEPSPPAYTHA
jgi:hypothetical protein